MVRRLIQVGNPAYVYLSFRAVGVGKSTFIQTYIEDAYVENVSKFNRAGDDTDKIRGRLNVQIVPSVVEPIQFDSRLGKIEFHDSGEDLAQSRDTLHKRIRDVRSDD